MLPRKASSGSLRFVCFVILSLIPAVVFAQYHPKDTEWASYAADLAGTRYRPLDQINASNFSNLEIAWRIKTDNFGDRAEYKLEGTPLMVNGVLYATAGSRRAVIAVDPERENCCGFTANTKASAAARPRDSFRGAGWRIGLKAWTNAFFM